MDMFGFAGLLFGGSRAGRDATTVTASGAASSSDGVASITLDADVTPAEDVGEDADQTIIDLPTSPDVAEGDEVIVTLVGDGPLKTPVVTANPGAGDRMRALANSAKTIANAAQAVAEAVNQHFWSADDGIHVTEATQEDWDESHTGANVLINSIGQLFRDGLNNLLTLTTESGARALTIWDGLGNSASNILARFSSDGISFADGTSFDIGDSSSYIHFDGNGHINIGGSGLTIGGYATNADVADAIDGISVGGRNLVSSLAANWRRTTVSESSSVGTSWVYMSRTASTTRISAIDLIPADGDFVTVSLASGYDAFLTFFDANGYMKKYLTWSNQRTVDLSNYSGVTAIGLTVRKSGNSTITLDDVALAKIKLERGTKATDWSPAPEDVDSAIYDAANGGRNWLLDTGTFNDWVSGTGITFSNGVATFTSRSSLWWASIRHFTIPAADFFGNTWTFSFDYRSDDFSDTSGNRYIQVNLEASASYNASDRTKYRALNSSSISGAANTWVPTTEWQRGSVTFTAADESFLSGGSGDVNYVGIAIWAYTLNSFQVRRMKLEKGNTATDWSTAPEDAAKTATSYVTEITGQNGIMVHPSTDDDTGVRITSDVDIRQDNVSIANFGALDSNNNPTARVGKVDDYHMSIDQDSLDMYDSTHKIASYSASVSSVDDGGVHDITVSETSIHVEPNPDYVAPSQDDPYAGTYDQPPSAGSLVVRGETRIAETTSADDEYESYIGMLAHSRCVNSDSGNVISAGVSVSTSGVMDSTGVRSTIDSKVSLSGNKLQLSREGKTGSGTSVTLDMYQVMQMLTNSSQTLTRGSAVSSWSSGTIRKSGKVVTMTINGAKLASALSSGSTSGSIATIPTGYRPTDNLQRGVACISITGNYANVWFVVGTTGNVAIANRSSLQIPTTAEISMQITYIID